MNEHISVCICTFKRSELLKFLLNKLQYQQTEGLFTYSIVVVDNDCNMSAKSVVNEMLNKTSVPIYYFIEPEQNIALARNKAVQNADGRYIAFIDDDEFPVKCWLLNLYKTYKKYRPDGGVLGPVKPYFLEKPPKWLIKGKFCNRPLFKTGTIMHWSDTRTGNVLLNKKILQDRQFVFSPEFRTGGEDVNFFKKMNEIGHVFIWSNNSPVYEIIPPNRCKKRYFLQRALLQGSISLKYYGNIIKIKDKIFIFFKSMTAIFIYSFILPFSFFIGFHTFFKYLIKDFHHISRIFGLCRISFIRERNF